MLDQAQLLYNKGEFKACWRCLNEMKDEHVQDSAYWLLLGYTHDQIAHLLLEGEAKLCGFIGAEKAFGMCVTLGKRREGLRGFGIVALHRGDFEKAYHLFYDLWLEDKTAVSVCMSLGNIERQRKHFLQAIQWYETYKQLAGPSWNIYSNLALTYRDAGNVVLSSTYAKEALKLMPDTQHPFMNELREELGQILQNRCI